LRAFIKCGLPSGEGAYFNAMVFPRDIIPLVKSCVSKTFTIFSVQKVRIGVQIGVVASQKRKAATKKTMNLSRNRTRIERRFFLDPA